MTNKRVLIILTTIAVVAIALGIYWVVGRYFRPSQEEVETSVISGARVAIQHYHLTDQRNECLAFQLSQTSQNIYIVDVRENHADSKCAGDPEASPRLFSLQVSRDGKVIATDEGSSDGNFHPLAK